MSSSQTIAYANLYSPASGTTIYFVSNAIFEHQSHSFAKRLLQMKRANERIGCQHTAEAIIKKWDYILWSSIAITLEYDNNKKHKRSRVSQLSHTFSSILLRHIAKTSETTIAKLNQTKRHQTRNSAPQFIKSVDI